MIPPAERGQAVDTCYGAGIHAGSVMGRPAASLAARGAVLPGDGRAFRITQPSLRR